MYELIGFAIGIITFFVILIFLLVTKGILWLWITVLVLIIISCLSGIIYLILEKRRKRNATIELNQVFANYLKVRENIEISSPHITFLEDFTDEQEEQLVEGQNLMWVYENHLYLFPDYPTIDNYLLYPDEIKPMIFSTREFISYEVIGELVDEKKKRKKMLETKIEFAGIASSEDYQDTRRVLVKYVKNHEKQELTLDFYSFEFLHEQFPTKYKK